MTILADTPPRSRKRARPSFDAPSDVTAPAESGWVFRSDAPADATSRVEPAPVATPEVAPPARIAAATRVRARRGSCARRAGARRRIRKSTAVCVGAARDRLLDDPGDAAAQAQGRRQIMSDTPKRGLEASAMKIVYRYMAVSAGAALIPVPGVDTAILAGVHVALIKQLCDHYSVDFSEHTARNVLIAVAGSIVPGTIGSVVS